MLCTTGNDRCRRTDYVCRCCYCRCCYCRLLMPLWVLVVGGCCWCCAVVVGDGGGCWWLLLGFGAGGIIVPLYVLLCTVAVTVVKMSITTIICSII